MAQFIADISYQGATMAQAIVEVSRVFGTKRGWNGLISIYSDAANQAANLPTKTFNLPAQIPFGTDADAPFQIILKALQTLPMFTNINSVVM